MSDKDRRPDIGFDAWLIDAFWQLSSMRQIGIDVGPIPYDRLVWYAEIHGLSAQFVETMEIADRLFLAKKDGESEEGEAGENGEA